MKFGTNNMVMFQHEKGTGALCKSSWLLANKHDYVSLSIYLSIVLIFHSNITTMLLFFLYVLSGVHRCLHVHVMIRVSSALSHVCEHVPWGNIKSSTKQCKSFQSDEHSIT